MEASARIGLADSGQSIWIDCIRRGMITSGELARLIEEDGVRGVTSNPSIFEKAIAGSRDYDVIIRRLALQGETPKQIYEDLAVKDVQMAADLFRGMYDRLQGRDGFVSLEVSPLLAHDTEGTVAEARRLWQAVSRPNLFIEVPATSEGLPAITRLIGEGINVNVTLLFGLPRYTEVVEAYIAGLEALASRGGQLDRVASVASFFLSRIDSAVDPLLSRKAQDAGKDGQTASRLRGEVAVASAKIAYHIFKNLFGRPGFQALARKGARVQRLLWASTSTKDPSYSDVKYVDPLVGPDTINTMTLETLNAFRDHGQPGSRIDADVDSAFRVLAELKHLGIDLSAVTQGLENEGLDRFTHALQRLLATIDQRSSTALKGSLDRQELHLGGHEAATWKRVDELEAKHFGRRLWLKDPSLWSTDKKEQQGIRGSLDWLGVAEKMEEALKELTLFAADIAHEELRRVVLLGMGGSSLAPLVLERIFGRTGGLPLTVLDTTDPATILRVEREVPIAQTLFIVSSKSGTTAEPLALGEYFYSRLSELRAGAGRNFVVITDPGTPLARMGKEREYRRVFLNFPGIGGRYSALSYFGLVPAALMGIDVAELVALALRMAHACASCVPVPENPGVILGAALGELAAHGRDKVTFLMPRQIAPLGMWLEQLLAESTGKRGTGLLPVAGEPLGRPDVYGEDRLFVHVRLKGEEDTELEKGVAALREDGLPVISIQMDGKLDLGQEFLRWEIATAAAGAVLGINPFDQPNVQEAKDSTNRVLELARKTGWAPPHHPSLTEDGLGFYTRSPDESAVETLRSFLSQAAQGDYFALLAYLPEEDPTEKQLQSIRVLVRDQLHLATTSGYGPRYLHSTGQYHKGGPKTGLFLILTADNAADASVPGQPYTFGLLKSAQVTGDREVLQRQGRRVMRIHLGADVPRGLGTLRRWIEAALDGVHPRQATAAGSGRRPR